MAEVVVGSQLARWPGEDAAVVVTLNEGFLQGPQLCHRFKKKKLEVMMMAFEAFSLPAASIWKTAHG